MPFEPVILFFLLGLLAGLARSDLKIPAVLYESLSIFLLLAIGLKGGVELARQSLAELLLPALVIVGIGAVWFSGRVVRPRTTRPDVPSMH